jgi:hypothetical protein
MTMKSLILVLFLTSLLAPSVSVQKQQTDRETRNLKGNVKRVESETSRMDQTSNRPERARQRTSREEFDASGNLTVETRYDQYGDIVSILTYSYLDGERVVKEQTRDKRGLSVRPRNPGPRRAPDPPYTAKLQYKYDSNGNRIETTQVFSNGSPPTKQVYSYGSNQREEQIYSADGALTYKFAHKLDDKGNEVETVTTRYEDSRDPLQATTTYKYLEFDSQGNWTKRVESRGNESWITYRTIIYH